MKVEVLYFEGCPNHALTVEKVREALQSDYQSAEIREVEVRTQAEAESLGFLGSPSVRIDGLDIEPEARSLKSYGLSCRTYVEGAMRCGVPSSNLIRRALAEQREHLSGGNGVKPHESCCQSGPEGSTTATSSAGGTPEMRSGRTALLAGGVAAVLASTCCLGPLLLVTLGVSGAWIGNLARLEPYRPLFIVIAVVALFFAWRNIFRPVQTCHPDEVCAVPQTRRLYRFLFWISATLTLLALVYPYLAKYFY
jgi:mercuric ion transport protein